MIFYSASANSGQGGFFHAGIHASMPDDAVKITESRHAELLTAQASGRAIIAGKGGKPELAQARKPARVKLAAQALRTIKAEARRRILAIASLERQANDNAVISMRAVALASGTPSEQPEYAAAVDRRSRIDTIRQHSNQAEAAITSWSAPALLAFDPADARWWPDWSI